MALAPFDQLLATAMRQKGLDYRTLAKLVGVSHGYLWQLANAEKRALNEPGAKRKRPSEALTRQLAGVLGLDPQALLEAAGYGEAPAEPPPTGPTRYATYQPEGRALYQEAIEAAGRGQPDRAVTLLEAAIAKGGVSFVNAHAGLGLAHFQAGRHAVAVAEFDAALGALAEGAEGGISASDLHYNRGLAHQRHARALEGPAQVRARRAAAADFGRAIALEGESQDLYHSALCYLFLESGRPRRVLPWARSFLARQARQPRYTTAALDVQLFLAHAHAELGDPATGSAMADVALQLCPGYWFGHYVRAVLLARWGNRGQREARLRAGLVHVETALRLNRESRSHFLAELEGDFAGWADHPDFRALLAAA